MNIGTLREMVNALLFGRHIYIADNNEASRILGANTNIPVSRSKMKDRCQHLVLGFVKEYANKLDHNYERPRGTVRNLVGVSMKSFLTVLVHLMI
jgi:hypothetical protein